MSDIKYVIERLGRDWNFGDVLRHKQRKSLISPFGEFKVLVPAGPNITQSFSFQYKKDTNDIRIWTKTFNGLLQWRSCPVKGNRLVYRPFGKDSTTERVDLEDIFMDPLNVEDDEVAMFEMLYADILPLIPMFGDALDKADYRLGVLI